MFMQGPLSNDVAVIDTDISDDAPGAGRNSGGVLANLPRTRPQRASARRTAARASTGTSTARSNGERKPSRGKQTPAKTTKAATGRRRTNATSVKAVTESSASATAKAPGGARSRRTPSAKQGAPRRTAARKARQTPLEEPAPRQGFESEGEPTGGSIQPPGGTELVAAAAEIVGELAKAGLSTGERLFKDVLSRLPLS